MSHTHNLYTHSTLSDWRLDRIVSLGLNVCSYVYVCRYVCVCECVFVCRYVCVFIDPHTHNMLSDWCLNKTESLGLYVCRYVCVRKHMCVCVCVCVFVRRYVCVFIISYKHTTISNWRLNRI